MGIDVLDNTVRSGLCQGWSVKLWNLTKQPLVSLIILALGLSGSASASKKTRNWQTGKLLDSHRSQNPVGAVDHPPIGFDNRRRTTVVFETQDTFVIEDGLLTYTVSEIVRGTKPANVTVNGQVKFVIEGTTLYLMDDGGKEHKTDVTKKVLRQSPESSK